MGSNLFIELVGEVFPSSHLRRVIRDGRIGNRDASSRFTVWISTSGSSCLRRRTSSYIFCLSSVERILKYPRMNLAMRFNRP